MQVFQIAYCDIFKPSLADSCRDACHTFVNAAKRHMPTLLEKHLLLHLVDCMIQFGPSSAFSVERFESFNANVRTYNIFGNRLAPSWDIAQRFSTCSICATSVLMVWVPMKGVALPLSMSTQCHLCSTWYFYACAKRYVPTRSTAKGFKVFTSLCLVSAGRQNTTLDILKECGIHCNLVLGSIMLTCHRMSCSYVAGT
eukprot:Em0003g162a